MRFKSKNRFYVQAWHKSLLLCLLNRKEIDSWTVFQIKYDNCNNSSTIDKTFPQYWQYVKLYIATFSPGLRTEHRIFSTIQKAYINGQRTNISFWHFPNSVIILALKNISPYTETAQTVASEVTEHWTISTLFWSLTVPLYIIMPIIRVRLIMNYVILSLHYSLN